MFNLKRLKDRINVVSEDIKNDPRFRDGLASVNKMAQDAVTAMQKSESAQSLQGEVNKLYNYNCKCLNIKVFEPYGTRVNFN